MAAAHLLPKIIGGFNHIYPDIRVSLQIGDSRQIVQKTLSGEIEIGLVGAFFHVAHIHGSIFSRDTLKLIVPSWHPWADKSSILIEVLRKEPMIIREPGSGTLQVIKKALRDKGVALLDQFRIVAEIGNTAGIVGGIKSGLGVSILSTRAVEDDLRNGSLKALDIPEIDLERYFYLVMDQRRSLSPLARGFRDYMMAQAE